MSETQRISFPQLNPITSAATDDEVLLQVEGEARRATLNVLRNVFADATTQITIINNDGLEVGMYADFAGDSVPVSYLLCDGSAVSRTTYAALFAVIGTKYGVGDGSTTFNLPNKNSTTVQPASVTVLPCIKAFKLSYSGGSAQGATTYLGQIITTAVPLPSNSTKVLHLNGQTVNKTDNDVISNFIDYITLIASSYPNLLATTDEYEADITAYGSCGKFVLDTSAGTLRVPTISNILQGTTSASQIGDIIEPGLPNITGSLGGNLVIHDPSVTGAMSASSVKTYLSDQVSGSTPNWNISANGGERFVTASIDASDSNDIYGSSTTVQPPAVKVFHYIVIDSDSADSKADTNLSNLTDVGKTAVAHLGMPSSSKTALTYPSTSGSTITAPADGYIVGKFTGATGLSVSIDVYDGETYIASYVATYGFSAYYYVVPIAKGQIAKIWHSSAPTAKIFKFNYAIGSAPSSTDTSGGDSSGGDSSGDTEETVEEATHYITVAEISNGVYGYQA